MSKRSQLAATLTPGNRKTPAKAQFAYMEVQTPYPDVETLRGYDAVQKGFAERIIVMAEQSQAHRHEMENKALRAAHREASFGQWFAFIICMAAMGFSYFKESHWTNTVIGSGALLGLVTTFILGRHRVTLQKQASQPHSQPETQEVVKHD